MDPILFEPHLNLLIRLCNKLLGIFFVIDKDTFKLLILFESPICKLTNYLPITSGTDLNGKLKLETNNNIVLKT